MSPSAYRRQKWFDASDGSRNLARMRSTVQKQARQLQARDMGRSDISGIAIMIPSKGRECGGHLTLRRGSFFLPPDHFPETDFQAFVVKVSVSSTV